MGYDGLWTVVEKVEEGCERAKKNDHVMRHCELELARFLLSANPPPHISSLS
jgi:hypothetical protein